MKTRSDSEIMVPDFSTLDAGSVDLVSIVKVCLDNRWIILLAMLASICATVGLSLSAPPTYHSTATIQAAGPGIVWIDLNESKLFWQGDKLVHEVAAEKKINLVGADAKAQVERGPVTDDAAQIAIEVTAGKPGTSKRLAKGLADHFVTTANALSDRPHVINHQERRYREELALTLEQIKLFENKRKSLMEDAEVMKVTVRGLDMAARNTPTGLMLNMQYHVVQNGLLGVDDRLLDLKTGRSELRWLIRQEVKLRILTVDPVSEPLKKETRTLFNGIVAGLIAFIVVTFLLYIREFRLDNQNRLSIRS